ncbi:M15 family metallopeptidase [Vallitalea okinawensis]|uniref:M15 family metallopeptidase n=1 Tax=Vallitalea okinawensis TaxID=2078660 RepID=UPI000CFC3679|nr:M15 family metallopeptidase [Vallitalea okinawensis]
MTKRIPFAILFMLIVIVFMQITTAHPSEDEKVIETTHPMETIEVIEVEEPVDTPPSKDIEGIIQLIIQDELPELLLVSQDYPLQEDLSQGIVVNTVPSNKYMSINQETLDALEELFSASQSFGIQDLLLTSAYRDIAYQEMLFEKQMNRYRGTHTEDQAYALASQAVAPPGTSEHQTGMAVDFLSTTQYTLTESFDGTPSGQWLLENAYRYGFILRYPKDKTDITGIMYEPWHYRYVGQVHSEYIHKHHLCLEDYLHLLENEKRISFITESGNAYEIYYINDIQGFDFNTTNIDTHNIVDVSHIGDDSYIVTLAMASY